jgi:hypothetical protein
MVQRKLWSSIPPSVKSQYDRANADFRAARRSVATTEACEASSVAEAAERARQKAALVVSAKAIDPELARKNIRAAYERQLAEGVDALSAAIAKRRAPRLTPKRKPSRRPNQSCRSCC